MMKRKDLAFVYGYLVHLYFQAKKASPTLKKYPDGKSGIKDNIPGELRRKLRVLYEILEMASETAINIYAEEGTKVMHDGHTGSAANNLEENARNLLVKGKIYTIDTSLPADWFTLVQLKEFPGVLFSSSVFTPVEKSSRSFEDLLAEYGPDLESDFEAAKWTHRLLKKQGKI
ncbi:hypothetical protein [Dethiobacter alkaliphilus]|uniref:Uncharacterized protein n=1 Tax=Dethiobacter alkaliphilus AHT 1 TaxID=555088 RepID=C0GD30_DETAL|nr:hypothetical protein [Dethiobacter alkaliphilus]EEG79115.1 hypothetical protein DealDRAFT_0389 [Dethiobacter alkaliphilus AHT 1]